MDESLKTLASRLTPLGDGFHERGIFLAKEGWIASLPIFNRDLAFGISSEDLNEQEIIEKESCKVALSNGSYNSSLIEKLRKEAEERYSKSKYYVDRHITGYYRALSLIQQDGEKYRSYKSVVEEKIQQARETEIRENRLGYASTHNDSKALSVMTDQLVTHQLEQKEFARIKNKAIRNSFTYEKKVSENFFIYFGILRDPLVSKKGVRKGYIGKLEVGFGITCVSLNTVATMIPNLSYSMDVLFPLRRLPYINPYTYFRNAEELEVISLAQITMLNIITPGIEEIILNL